MKYIKIFQTLAVALTLALLVVAVPAKPALAQVLNVTPDEGEIGDRITVFGEGFTADASVYIYFSGEKAYVGDRLVELNSYQRVKTTQAGLYGTWEDVIDDYFTVPDELTHGDVDEDVRGGTYYVYAIYTVSPYYIEARAEFTVQSAGEITLDPDDGTVGTEVEITGGGFDDREDISVEYDGVEIDIVSGDETTDRDGEFEFTIIIPESTAGDHTITVIGDDSDIEVEAEFTVEPKITITPESGTSGDVITVSGTGFGYKSDITIDFNNFEVATDRTDKYGSFDITFYAPVSGAGSYDLEVEDEDGNSDEAEFTIVAAAAATLSTNTGCAGTEVAVSGTGFQASKPVTIWFDNTSVVTAPADSYGNFTTSFTVPVSTTGNHEVTISDGTRTVKADFFIEISASISPTTSTASPGHVGAALTVSGVGFTAGKMVTITYDGSQVAIATVNTDGSFSATFNPPASSGGEHIIIASDGTNTEQFTFVMESTPPATPLPLKPEMGIKAKAEAYFDWEDVEDPSGATYTLQIATDENFSEDSIVLEKTGLSQSEYTLTKEERLNSVSKEAPYYWHVKAVDSAYNESQWSGTGSFHVGFSLALSQTLIYVLCGVGALLFAVFAFWLGRKTAYY